MSRTELDALLERVRDPQGEPLQAIAMDCLRMFTDVAQGAYERGVSDERARGLIPYLERQWDWSKRTSGTGLRTKGIIQHITKELVEIQAEPNDLLAWVDVMILAMDGYWRHGGTPESLMLDLLSCPAAAAEDLSNPPRLG